MKDDKGITPAALMALLGGDIDNAIVASTPGGIEAQEAAGQAAFVASQTLPIDCPREDLETLGFVFGEEKNDLFVNVMFPEGWEMVATDHAMWSNLLDPRGRTRATMFYKAAFYDQSADMNLIPFINCGKVHGLNSNKDENNLQYNVTAGGEVVYVTEVHVPKPYSDEYFSICNELSAEVMAWAKVHYPDKEEGAASYWDE